MQFFKNNSSYLGKTFTLQAIKCAKQACLNRKISKPIVLKALGTCGCLGCLKNDGSCWMLLRGWREKDSRSWRSRRHGGYGGRPDHWWPVTLDACVWMKILILDLWRVWGFIGIHSAARAVMEKHLCTGGRWCLQFAVSAKVCVKKFTSSWLRTGGRADETSDYKLLLC
jgi:hypothetical protein